MGCCADNDTGIGVEVMVASHNIQPFVITVGSGPNRSIELYTDVAGYYNLRVWLIDSATDPSEMTLDIPKAGEEASWDVVTDATGKATIAIDADQVGTWYLAVLVIGEVIISAAVGFPSVAVSGTITPDATGNYSYTGQHNGQNSYEDGAATFYIWYEGGIWYITDAAPGGGGTTVWYKVGGGATGTYAPFTILTVTGNPVVA